MENHRLRRGIAKMEVRTLEHDERRKGNPVESGNHFATVIRMVTHMGETMNMDTTNRSTIVGIFDDRQQAERAVDALHNAGFHDDEIGYLRRQGDPLEGTTAIDDTNKKGHTGETVGTGALIGGLVGAAAALLIPGVGPALAGGVLYSTLGATAAGGAIVGAVGGAVAGGLIGALTDMGVPEDEARYADEQFRAGRTLVTVRTNGRADEASMILDRFGGYNIHTKRSGTTSTTTTTEQAYRDAQPPSEASRPATPYPGSTTMRPEETTDEALRRENQGGTSRRVR